MIQLRGLNVFDVVNIEVKLLKIANKAKDLTKKVALDDLIKTVDTSKKSFKNFDKVLGTGTTLTNNEIKYIMKVIKYLENRRTL